MKPRHALPRKPPHKPDPLTGGDMPGVGSGEDLGGGLTEAEVDAEKWLGRPGSPNAKLAMEKPRGRNRRLRRPAPGRARGPGALRPDFNAERRNKAAGGFPPLLFFGCGAAARRDPPGRLARPGPVTHRGGEIGEW